MTTVYIITTAILWGIATLSHFYKGFDDRDGTEGVSGVVTLVLFMWAILILMFPS